MAAMVLGRAVPYTPFEHSPFEGARMEEIERLRLRGVSEKEISARYAGPHPQPLAFATPSSALDVATPATARHRFRKILSNTIARAIVATERQGDASEAVEETLHAASENMDVKRNTLLLQASQDLDKRADAAQGSGEVLVEAGGVVGVVERGGDNSIRNEEELGSRGLDTITRDTEKRSPSDEGQQDRELQVYENNLDQRQGAAGERSENTEAGVAKEKRTINIDAEDGGLEVRGRMGGLIGE